MLIWFWHKKYDTVITYQLLDTLLQITKWGETKEKEKFQLFLKLSKWVV